MIAIGVIYTFCESAYQHQFPSLWYAGGCKFTSPVNARTRRAARSISIALRLPPSTRDASGGYASSLDRRGVPAAPRLLLRWCSHPTSMRRGFVGLGLLPSNRHQRLICMSNLLHKSERLKFYPLAHCEMAHSMAVFRKCLYFYDESSVRSESGAATIAADMVEFLMWRTE